MPNLGDRLFILMSKKTVKRQAVSMDDDEDRPKNMTLVKKAQSKKKKVGGTRPGVARKRSSVRQASQPKGEVRPSNEDEDQSEETMNEQPEPVVEVSEVTKSEPEKEVEAEKEELTPEFEDQKQSKPTRDVKEEPEVPNEAEEPKPVVEAKKEPKPVVEAKEDSKPVVEAKEDSKPVVEAKEEPKPVVEAKKEPKPVVEAKEEPKPVVEAKKETKPVVEAKEEPKPVVEAKKETKSSVEEKKDYDADSSYVVPPSIGDEGIKVPRPPRDRPAKQFKHVERATSDILEKKKIISFEWDLEEIAFKWQDWSSARVANYWRDFGKQ